MGVERENLCGSWTLGPNLFVWPAMRDEMRGSRQKNLAFVWFMELGLGSCIISQDERL